jgi:uncharacterized repeat protein (TIGR02543 family)
VFRRYLSVKYPVANFDDATVTKQWADQVTYLEGENFGISGGGFVHDITGIEIFENLESFTSGYSKGFPEVRDFSPMSHLSKLQSVTFNKVGQPGNNGDINHANLTSWNSQNMPELHVVDMTGSLFWDASQLGGLTGLTYLNLSSTAMGVDGANSSGAIDDSLPRATDPFRNFPTMFPNLQTLTIDDCESLTKASFEPLTGLHNLGTLNMNADAHAIHGQIPEPVSRMTSLFELNMDENSISDVTPLKGLMNLKRLDISWNSISDLTPLASLTQLTKLKADDQHLTLPKDLVSNPNVTVGVDAFKNLGGTPVRFTGDAYYHYLDVHGELPAPRLSPESVRVSDRQIELIDPHIDGGRFVMPGEQAEDPDPQIIDGQLRGGLLCLHFVGANPGLPGLVDFSFDGELAPHVRSPQVTIDPRGGTVRGSQSPAPVDVISGHVLGDKMPANPDWVQANGNVNQFLGWKACVSGVSGTGACSFATAVPFDPSQPINDDTILYAHWKSDDARQIFFQPQNGDPATVQTAYIGDTVKEPSAPPTFRGHKFLGWFTDRNAGAPYDFGQTVSDDLTLYAHWEDVKPEIRNYVVRFDPENGTDHLVVFTKAGDRVARPVDPTLQGYRFDGWYTDHAKGGNLYDFNVPVNEDMVLYARWTLVSNATPRTSTFNLYTPLIATAPGANSRKAAPAQGDKRVGRRNAPRGYGRDLLCGTAESRFVSPISDVYVERFGRVQRIDNKSVDCQREPSATQPGRYGIMFLWLWLLLLLALLLCVYLRSRDRIPDIGQHKSAEIYD